MNQLGPLSEALDTELKGWLDLSNEREAAKLARACLALRNHNGGRVILGVDDKSCRPSEQGRPGNLTTKYHPDKVNEVVGRYANPRFEVRVEQMMYEGVVVLVITVPGGIELPVVARRVFEKEIRQNAVYVRSISNGRVSSSEPATTQDWEGLIRRCFENREADIGRFVAKYLPRLVAAADRAGEPPAIASLNQCRQAFDRSFAERSDVSQYVSSAVKTGLRESAFAVTGGIEEVCIARLLDHFLIREPHMTGWPPWVDSRGFRDQDARPYVRGTGWEAFIARGHDWDVGSLTFWRIESGGRFYTLSTLEDDTSKSLLDRGVKPGQVLDFLLVISRTAEAVEVARVFAESIAKDRDRAELECAFRWSGLKGRTLACWVEPGRSIISGVEARDEQVVATAALPVGAPQSRVGEAVKQLTKPVFERFGKEFGDGVIDEIVDRTLKRRL